MDTALAEKIAKLPTLNKTQLLTIWAENFTTPPPPTLRKQLMVPVLAYRMQERAFGGLSHSARKRLQEIARSMASERGRAKENAAAPQTGTKLIRIWRSEVHEVISTPEGYQYRGRQFTSLSRIAREITGTQWSGPAFFGTKEKKK